MDKTMSGIFQKAKARKSVDSVLQSNLAKVSKQIRALHDFRVWAKENSQANEEPATDAHWADLSAACENLLDWSAARQHGQYCGLIGHKECVAGFHPEVVRTAWKHVIKLLSVRQKVTRSNRKFIRGQGIAYDALLDMHRASEFLNT